MIVDLTLIMKADDVWSLRETGGGFVPAMKIDTKCISVDILFDDIEQARAVAADLILLCYRMQES